MTRKTETIEHLDASIARWKTRMKRAMTMVEKLEKRRKRMAIKTVVARQLAKQEKVVVFEPDVSVPPSLLGTGGHDGGSVEPHATAAPPTVAPAADLDIPEFLRRGQAAQKAVDAVIADQIREENAAAKTAKARGRIATMKAKKSGETRKMPLTGKAARDLINNG